MQIYEKSLSRGPGKNSKQMFGANMEVVQPSKNIKGLTIQGRQWELSQNSAQCSRIRYTQILKFKLRQSLLPSKPAEAIVDKIKPLFCLYHKPNVCLLLELESVPGCIVQGPFMCNLMKKIFWFCWRTAKAQTGQSPRKLFKNCTFLGVFEKAPPPFF